MRQSGHLPTLAIGDDVRVPTGVAIHDEQLFAAAERVLLRDGSNGLTSRAVTTEAGCAKGVLHRHFADFDAFLAALVRDRIARLQPIEAGTSTVAETLTAALTGIFGPVAVGIVGLVTSRHALLARLRTTTPKGIPLLTEATAVIAAYLTTERDRGRLPPDADVAVLAPTLVGAAHLLFAGGGDPATLHDTVAAVLP
jgi:AcrR family transcriptional regulator